jgi:hypothetical protein
MQRTTQWLGQMGAALGVIISLSLVAYEMKQSREFARAELEATAVQLTIANGSLLSDPAVAKIWAKAIRDPDALMPGEVVVVDWVLANVIQVWWQLMLMSEEGLVTKERVARSIQNEAPYYFGSVFGQRFWRAEGVGWQGTEFMTISDPILSGVDPMFLQKRLSALLGSEAID